MKVVKEFHFSAPGIYTILAYNIKAKDSKKLLMDKLGFTSDSIKINENTIEIMEEFKDQCHLSGVLTALNDLHFTILSVNRTDKFDD